MNRQQAEAALRNIYRDVLGRDLDAGAEVWIQELIAGKGEQWVREQLSQSDEAITRHIHLNYGSTVAALLDVPELRDILFKAARDEWDQVRVKSAIESSNWYRSNSDAQRKWDTLTKLDPTEAERLRTSRKAEIRSAAQQLGIPLPEDRIGNITENSLRMGWTPLQLDSAIRAEFDYVQGQVIPAQQGAIAVTFDAMKTAASQWGVDIDEPTIETWLEQIIKQQTTMDNFSIYLKEESKSRWPALSSLIDDGHSPEQIFNSYRNTAARLLGLNPASISLNDPKWARFMGYVDPKSGEMRMMDIYEAERTIKQDPAYGWKQTKGAMDEASEFALNLGKIFGKVPA